jgi:pyridinium-3,5-biscarboxylic acid mononucleotide sulfurtransferase
MTAAAANPLDQKVEQLEEILRTLGCVMVAYSGGVDSALLAVAAQRVLGEKCVAVTAASESLATGELDDAAALCQQFGIRHEVLHTREIDNPDYARNPPNRCYFCKLELLDAIQQLANDLGVPYVIYGQNADDSDDFRPGAQAASERGVRAPLAEVGMTKAEIRELSRAWDIPVWDRPATACLSSRFPYGTPITADALRQVDRAERLLRDDGGFSQLRSRHHGDTARIELPAENVSALLLDQRLRADLVLAYRKIGYTRVTLDLRGFRSGSMNEVLIQLETAPTDVPQGLAQAFTEAEAGPASWEADAQMLYVQLPQDAFSLLAEPARRQALVERIDRLGFRYLALDLVPLAE